MHGDGFALLGWALFGQPGMAPRLHDLSLQAGSSLCDQTVQVISLARCPYGFGFGLVWGCEFPSGPLCIIFNGWLGWLFSPLPFFPWWLVLAPSSPHLTCVRYFPLGSRVFSFPSCSVLFCCSIALGVFLVTACFVPLPMVAGGVCVPIDLPVFVVASAVFM